MQLMLRFSNACRAYTAALPNAIHFALVAHPSAGTARPGGRTARNRAAIFAATLAELAQHGYTNLSFDAIAARAGVHKTTIYRRWPTRAELVAAAFMDVAEQRLDVADTGNIDRDARALARSVAAVLAQPALAAAARAALAVSAP